MFWGRDEDGGERSNGVAKEKEASPMHAPCLRSWGPDQAAARLTLTAAWPALHACVRTHKNDGIQITRKHLDARHERSGALASMLGYNPKVRG